MCNMLIDRIFNGNDAVYGLTVQAVDGAIAQHGADKAVGFPHTAYLPALLLCSYRRKSENTGRDERSSWCCKDLDDERTAAG